jgi:hypothetical protein
MGTPGHTFGALRVTGTLTFIIHMV